MHGALSSFKYKIFKTRDEIFRTAIFDPEEIAGKSNSNGINNEGSFS